MSNQNKQETAVAERKPTVSQRFTSEVKRQLSGALNQQVDLSEHQRQLMTNMFVKLDSALEEHEARRQRDNKKGTPYTWDNVDMQKLALDAMHRIRLGLDALIPNHLHAIPYFNGKTKKYDLSLMIGYKGKLYYRKQVAIHPVKDVRIELVHENDEFTVTKKSGQGGIEDYTFKIKNPFDRGGVKGGFGYIEYDDEKKNELVIVTKEDFDKSKNAAKSNKFWGPWEERMQLKTLSHRTAEAIDIDPRKVNKSFHYVEAQDNPYSDDMEVKIEQPTDRKAIDIDLGDNDTATPELVETQTTSTNGNNGADLSTDDRDRKDVLIQKCNDIGKGMHGTGWFSKSKDYARKFNPQAGNLLDLTIEQLESLKAALEDEAKGGA